MVRTELTRVRAAADAWRKGLGALLAGLVGFSLVKGRSDVGAVDYHVAVVVGLLLLIALGTGAAGGLLLVRAAHGRPVVVSRDRLLPEPISTHQEALDSARKLRLGIAGTMTCAVLLVAAVGLTWYGPPRAEPLLRVVHTSDTTCGSVVRIGAGSLVLTTSAGELTIPLDTVQGLQPVTSC